MLGKPFRRGLSRSIYETENDGSSNARHVHVWRVDSRRLNELPSKHLGRFQTFHLFLQLFSLCNNLGSLLWPKANPNRTNE